MIIEDLDITKYAIEAINKENWKKAPGIKYRRGMTNSALAPRDYDVKCDPRHKICCIKGYFIWWCSAHHQPYAWCNGKEDLIELRRRITKAIEE